MLLLLAGLPLVAGAHPHPDETQRHGPETLTVSAAELERFAHAMLAIERIETQAGNDLATAQSREEAAALRSARERRVQRALREYGLDDPDSYQRIRHALAHDRELREQLRRYLTELKKSEAPVAE
jgi:hypothetical protein